MRISLRQYADVVASEPTSPTSATRTMLRDIQSGAAPLSKVNVGHSVIAVIGIDRYADWPRLDNAVSDASAASRLFTQLGFLELTPPLLDEAATGEAMRRLVTDDLAQLSPEDSLVLFFAGHGHTHTARFGDMSVKTGCVIPVDGSRPRGHVASSWLRLDAWLSDIARLPPRHILVIVDACHSGVSLGALHKWRDEGREVTTELAALRARRSRRIITSALDDQRAMDGGPYPGHSLFTGCLIEALSGGLAEGGQRVATGRELGHYLQKRVRSYPPSTQTPDFGTFELDDRGDIIVPLALEEFRSRRTAPTTRESGALVPRLRSRRFATIATGLMATALAGGAVLVGNGNDGAGPGRAAGDAAADDTRSARSETWSGRPDASVEPATTMSSNSPRVGAVDAEPAAEEAMTATAPVDASSQDAWIATASRRSYQEASKQPPLAPRPHDRSEKPHSISEDVMTTFGNTVLPIDHAQPSTSEPPPVHITPEPAPTADKCSAATFAAVFNADAPTRDTVRAALRGLNDCLKAGTIKDADFMRYQTALVAKLL